MSVTEALRTTPKGRLKYSREINNVKLEGELIQVSPPPLSRHHEEKESSKLNLSFGLHCNDFNKLVEGESNSTLKEGSSNNQNEICQVPDKSVISPNSNGLVTSPGLARNKQSQSPKGEEILWPAVSPSLLNALQMNNILHIQEVFESRAKISLSKRRRKYEEHNSKMVHLESNSREDTRRKMEHLHEKRQSSIERKQQVQRAEVDKNLQSLKESHKRHKEKIDSKQKEIEQKRLDLEKEQQKKQEELERRHQVLKSLMAQVLESGSKFTQIYETFEHRNLFPEVMAKFKAAVDKATTRLPVKMQQAVQSGNITDELVAEFQDNVGKMKTTLLLITKQVEEISNRLKEAADMKKQEEAKQAEDLAKAENAKKQEAAAAQDCGVQALSYALQERKANFELLAQVEASINGFVTNSNPQMKQYRFDLQRAVNTPINAISGVDSHHLRDKLHRLVALLRGEEVKVSGRSVRADRTPEARLFCQNLVAKMLVRKGEEQVSSLHESAFPIAAVLLGVWCEFEIVGKLFLAHLTARCPYVLPYYHTCQEGETSADYHRALGYKVEDDGTVEEQDKFLRRMSGLMRLYCACLVTRPPPPTPGGAAPRSPLHPQGLEHAWMWLARTMDQAPHPDATATLTLDVVSVCGHQLLRRYSVQFIKLVYLLYKHFLPKLREVAVTSATLGRLESFLEVALRSGRIAEPDGVLSPGFWSH
ncbi:hypothetical protein EGW08_014379 [Elysia chlorotica]|uniref:mRNA export factor GLE1 n=1 Tax=Elysia chlorotica TaxID=188477 RepID=A0A3S1BD22_ELYCH|nr:hypothetical protein EGW08_014379 [Elysia chlorotica]